MKRPLILYLLCFLHLFLGLSACAGGILLMIKSDGSYLGMQAGWLRDSPFGDYFIPGFILFVFNGLLPLFTCSGLLFKPKRSRANALNIYRNKHWSWTYSLYSGIIIIAWISVQIMMTPYFWLQPVMIFTGLLIIIFTMIPDVMNYFEND